MAPVRPRSRIPGQERRASDLTRTASPSAVPVRAAPSHPGQRHEIRPLVDKHTEEKKLFG